MAQDDRTEKEFVATTFSRSASTYDRVGPPFFSRAGRRLVELANIPRGSRVLDIAAGRGAVLFPAGERVGSEGRVIGIDLSEGMVEETSAEIQRRGLKNVEIRHGDAEPLDLEDDSFDVLFSGFSFFFFPHLDRALAEFRRVVKPGGKIGVTTFGKAEERWQWYQDLLNSYRQPNGLARRLQEPIFRSADGMESILRDAGFSSVRVLPDEFDLVYRDEQEGWSRLTSFMARRALESMTPETIEKFKAEAFEKIQANKQPDGIHQLNRVLYTFATKPND